MADRKISDLTALTTPASGDYLPIVDISEAAAASKNKRITIEELMRGVPDGTAAAPGIAFETDPNTGIYSPGADQLAVATNGTQRLYVGSTGSVGVGIAGPVTKLDIRDASEVGITIGTTSTPYGRFYTDGTITSLLGFNNSPLVFSTNSGTAFAERLRITTAGLVGIGTSAPIATTHIMLSDVTGFSSPANDGLVVERGGGNDLAITIATNNDRNGYLLFADSDSSNPGWIGYDHSVNAMSFKVNASERARIDSSGRLLVGTSAALTGGDAQYSLLQVVGSQLANDYAIVVIGREQAATVITSGQNIGQISFTDNGGNEFGTIKCTADANAGSGDYPGRIIFSTTADGAASPTERMRISATGRTSCFSSEDAVYSRTAAAAGTSVAVFVGSHTATNTTNGTASSIIWSNGNIVNTNNSYGSISDIKLKENIVDANSQWDDLKALQVRNYNFKEGQTHTQIGLVAQEVELVSPGLVSESPDRDAEGNDLGTVTKSVNYSVLYMKAVKALQEAMERIETLEAAVTALQQS